MANDVIRFVTGLETNLSSEPKKKGKILFAITEDNNGQIYFDKDNNTRIKMSQHALTADQLSNGHIFKISDSDKTNTGSTVTFNGTQDVELLLPLNVKFNNILATSDITLDTGNVNIVDVLQTDKFLGFYNDANKTAGASWRIGHIGSGTGNEKYFVIQSGTSNTSATTWNDVLRLGIDNFNAFFKGDVNPQITDTQSLGTSSLRWYSIYATNLYGNATSASQIYSTLTAPPIGYIEFQSNQSTESGNVNLKHHNSLRVDSNVSTSATTLAQTNLIVGNSTQEGSTGNSRGVLSLYGPGMYETKIFSTVSAASNNLYIPEYTGDGYVVTASSASAEGSNTNPIYIAANGRATKLTYTANRLYYSASTSSFEAGNHYVNNTKIGINTTTEPSYNLYISGTSYVSSNSNIGGTLGVTGATSLGSTLSVTGNSTFTGQATFNNDVIISGLSANQVVITDDNKKLISRNISDSNSAETLGTSTNIVTERDVYYSLPKINNAHDYTSISDYYAPITGGDSGQMLFAVGTTSAPVWDTPRIEGVQIKKGATFYYGYCETAADTAAKTVTLTGTQIFTLETGARVIIKFKETNTATNPTLNVNSKGAKNICKYGTTSIGNTIATSWAAGAIIEFIFDGTNWIMTGYSTGRIEPGESGYILVGNGTNADPIWKNILGVAHGGTGLSSFTPNRLYYPSETTTLSAGNHYISDTKIAVNAISEPSYNLYVSGTSYVSGNTNIGGTLGVTGAVTLGNTLSVTGNSTFTGSVTFNNDINTVLDANKVVMTDTNKKLTIRTLSDSSSAEALSNLSTNIVTERDIYYGLPSINNAHDYTSSTTIYAPNEGGDSGALLFANGATSTPSWAKARIEGVQIKGGEIPSTLHYGFCDTAANTAAKTVTLTGTQIFTLETGARVIIKFQNSNTANNATLNVNNTGAAPIYKYNSIPVGIREATSWKPNSVVEFVYDGTGWIIAASGGGSLDLQENQTKKAFLTGYNDDDDIYYYDTDTYLTTVAGLLYSKYLKTKYLRVNSDDIDTEKETIINGNVDIGTGDPFFTGNGTKINLTNSNESTPFTVNNSSYTFNYDSTNEVWVNSNSGTSSSYRYTTAEKTWTAKDNYIITMDVYLNKHSDDIFKVFINDIEKYNNDDIIEGSNLTTTLNFNLQTNDNIKIYFYKGYNINSSYTHSAKLAIKYELATTAKTYTTMKDATSFTDITQSTSISTGAVTIDGGVGIAKNVNIGGNIIADGDASFTNGTLITQNIVTGDGTDIILNNSNISTYFTLENDISYPWVAPNANYTTTTYTPSESFFDITSSNIGTYFTVTNPSNNGVAWTWDSTEGAYEAGSTTTNQKYYIDFTATEPGLLKFQYKKHAYSNDQFYIYYIRSGTTSQTQIFGDTSSRQYTTYYSCNNNEWRVEPGDKVRFYFNRQANTSTSYTHTVFVKIQYQILTTITNQTNGNYWINSNYTDFTINTTSSLRLTAKQDCILSLDGTGSNTSGDTFTVYKNGTSIGTSTTINEIQVFDEDIIELQYERGNQLYNQYPNNTHQAHIILKYQTGTIGKEVVLNSRTRITDDTEAISTTSGALQIAGGIGVQGTGYFGNLNTDGELIVAGNITGDWIKGSHLRINSEDITNSKKVIINGNTDITGDINLGTGDPIYSADGTEITLNNDNIDTYFTKTNGEQFFRPPNSEWYTYEVIGSGSQSVLTNSNITSYFTSVTPTQNYNNSPIQDSEYPWVYNNSNECWEVQNTGTVHNFQSRIAWQVTTASYIKFDWSVYSESVNYDWLAIIINGVEIIKKGGSAQSGSFSQGLAPGDIVQLCMRKDNGGGPTSEYYRVKMTRWANSQTNTTTHLVGNYWENSNQSATNTTAEMTLVARQNCIFTISGTLNHTGSTFNILLNGNNIYTNTTEGTNTIINKSIDVPQNATIKLQFLRGTSTSTSYTYVAQLVLKTVNANVYNSVTTLKDVVRGLRTDESTSISTGAITTAGGLGVAKNTYIGGNLNVADTITNIGDVSLTDGTFKVQNFISGTGNLIILDGSNISTYFTLENDISYPWIAPNANYTSSWVASGSEIPITSSNDSTYFTITNPWAPWEFNSTENTYRAGGVNITASTDFKTVFTARQKCLIRFEYKRSAYGSNQNFYIYYTPNGGSQSTLVSSTGTVNQTSYILTDTYKLNIGDHFDIQFSRSTSTTSGYTHDCYVKIIYQAVNDGSLTNGNYWANGNCDAVNTTSSLRLTAKQNCMLSLNNVDSNITGGDTFTAFKNNASIGTSTTLNNIQVFNGDIIELRYARGVSQGAHQAHIVIKYQAGSSSKEIVSTSRVRITDTADAISYTTGALQVAGGIGAETVFTNWNKGNYLRINSIDENTNIRTLLNGRTDLTGDVNIGLGAIQFTGTSSETYVTSNNLENWFTKTDESYYFAVPTSDSDYWTNNNNSAAAYTYARSELTAKQNCILNFIIKLNGYSSDAFAIYLDDTKLYNKTNWNSTSFNDTYTLNVQNGQRVKLEFYKYNTNSSYTHQAQIQIKAQTATTTTPYTTMKDITSFTNTTESTSISTGAVKISGGVGIAKNANIGGNINVTGNANFTGGVFLTQNIVTGSGSDIVINDSNMTTYFTMINDNISPWIAPNANYTLNWVASGSQINITSSNASTYFTVTNPQTSINPDAVAWTWNSTEGAYQAGRSDAVATYYYMDFKAKQKCLLKFQYKKHAYSSDQFYIQYMPSGGSSFTTLAQNTSTAAQTTYTDIGSTYRLNTNDIIRLYFRRYTNTSTDYEHMVYIKPIYQAVIAGTSTVANGDYWMNGNFDDNDINTTSSLKLTAKNNCILSLDGTGSNISGDTFTVYKNNISIGTSTTLNNIQVFNGDIIELRYVRGNQTHNQYPNNTHQAHIVLKWKTGTIGKEAVINNNLRMPNLAAANGVIFTDDSKNLISKVVRINGIPLTSGVITGFGTCSTAADTADKVASMYTSSEQFILETGARIFIKFSNANTAANPTLNMNNTGAKPIRDFYNTNTNAYRSWRAGEMVEFVYDGSIWLRVGGSPDPYWRLPYGSCSTAANTAAKVVSITNFNLETGAHIFVKFQYNNTVANPTLNVNNTGAKTIYRYGTTTPGTVSELSWQPNAVVELIYDGAYWQMVNGNGGGITPGEAGYILTGAGTSAAPTWTNILPITHGGTGLSASPSMLTNLGSTTAANVLQASPRPGVTGTLPVGNGGTNLASFTTNRIYYASAATTLSASNHYINSSKVSINSTSEPSYNLYVNGSLYATTLILPTAASTTVGAVWIG